MLKKPMKDWTILNYANGSNEYEPEMYKLLKDSEKISSNNNVNIIVQISRENRQLARIIRPNEAIPDEKEDWVGVRRYCISESSSNFICDLGKINMADPRNLYDFIKWGIENYPAKHYMLVLGGHGASFVGTITDYSQNLPYIMGTKEMCRAINMIRADTGRKIDILLLDICYMNLVEIMYELGKDEQNTVDNVLTYIETGPASGLAYDKLTNLIEKSSDTDKVELIIEQIINNMNLNLIAFEINRSKLKKIKKISSELAFSYLNNKGEKKLTPFELLTKLNSNDPWYELCLDLQKSLSSIILYFNIVHQTNSNLVNIIYMELGELIKVYYKLSFAKNNYWTYLLSNKSSSEKLNINIQEKFEPIVILPDGLRSLIQVMNPYLDKQGIEAIYIKLISYKKWTWNLNPPVV